MCKEVESENGKISFLEIPSLCWDSCPHNLCCLSDPYSRRLWGRQILSIGKRGGGRAPMINRLISLVIFLSLVHKEMPIVQSLWEIFHLWNCSFYFLFSPRFRNHSNWHWFGDWHSKIRILSWILSNAKCKQSFPSLHDLFDLFCAPSSWLLYFFIVNCLQ